jgi:hypothetical protein
MCTFENERAVVVCDIALRRVREAVHAAFGDVVQLTPITGQGTWVEVPPSVDEEVFQRVAREAIAAAQEASNSAYRILDAQGRMKSLDLSTRCHGR